MPVTKRQKLRDNRVVLRRERRDDPGPHIGGLPGGDNMWVIVRSDNTDSEHDLQEEEARAREAASRVVPLQLPSTPFSSFTLSTSPSSQEGLKRKARVIEVTYINSGSDSDSSFASSSSNNSSSKEEENAQL
jgi:hypothetical protein